jgi:hypothetical protein
MAEPPRDHDAEWRTEFAFARTVKFRVVIAILIVALILSIALAGPKATTAFDSSSPWQPILSGAVAAYEMLSGRSGVSV